LKPRHDHMLLQDVDWHVLFSQAVVQNFKKGDVVLEKGHQFQRLYQLLNGQLHVQQEVCFYFICIVIN